MNCIILVPRGAEHQAVLRGLARRQTIARASMGNSSIRAIAIPAGRAIEPWLTSEFQPYEFQTFDAQSAMNPPTQFLVLGLCGGLNDQTRRGTVVLYRPHPTGLDQRLGIQSVQGLTIDRVLCLADDKRQLAQESEADVVDMESQWIVDYMQAWECPVHIVRVVSDDAIGDLPDLSAAFDRGGNLRPLALAIAFIQKPIAALRLVRGSLLALRQLEEWVAEFDLEHLKV